MALVLRYFHLDPKATTSSSSITTTLNLMNTSISNNTIAIEDKLNAITGKSLSSNDFTDYYKDKLRGIEEGAEVNVLADWDENDSTADSYIKNKPIIDTVVTENSDNLITSGAVYTAIDNLPEPMIFKGSLGTGGTILSLPSASSSNKGYTYKVITDDTYNGLTAKAGDVFISDGTTWVYIPSADEPNGTVTNVAVTVPTGLEVSGSPITTSGTLAITYAIGYAIPTLTDQAAWTAKQDAISDLSTIRSRADEGHTAYGWGNHANAGYLTSYVDTKYKLTLNNSTNGDSSGTSLGTFYAPTTAGTGFLKGTKSGDNITWSWDNSTYNNYSLPLASNNARGGVLVGYTTNATDRNYAVLLSGEKMYVNVPWTDTNTDTNTTYSISTGDSNGLIKVTPSSGSAYNVSVKGLGSRAYDSTDYLPLNSTWIPSVLTNAGMTRRHGFCYNTACMGWASNNSEMYVYTDGAFYQREGEYMCLDTGNYSSYALPLSGGTITGTSGDTPLVIRSADTDSWIGFQKSNGTFIGYIGCEGNVPKFYNGTTYTIWHSGNLTNLNQLTNGPGYITSSGSCNYASSAGNADTVDGYHASNIETAGWQSVATLSYNNGAYDYYWYKIQFPDSNLFACYDIAVSSDANYPLFSKYTLLLSNYNNNTSKSIVLFNNNTCNSMSNVTLRVAADANYVYIQANSKWTSHLRIRCVYGTNRFNSSAVGKSAWGSTSGFTKTTDFYDCKCAIRMNSSGAVTEDNGVLFLTDRIGIGTLSPTDILDVRGGITNIQGGIKTKRTDTSATGIFGVNSNDVGLLTISSANSTSNYAAVSMKYENSATHVGISTTSPDSNYNLSVQGTAKINGLLDIYPAGSTATGVSVYMSSEHGMGPAIIFDPNATSGIGTGSDYMRVGQGKTAAFITYGYGLNLHIYPHGLSNSGYFNSSGVWVGPSDRSLKRNISKPDEYKLHNIWLWAIEEGFKSFVWKDTNKEDFGAIAQEVLEVLPEVVDYNKENDLYGIDYTKLHSHLLASVILELKDTKEEIKLLQALIAELKLLLK